MPSRSPAVVSSPTCCKLVSLADKVSVQGALQWLEDNQDKPLDEIKASAANNEDDDDEEETQAKISELESGQARSLTCNDCGKRFRNQDFASYHASKTYVRRSMITQDLLLTLR